MPNHFDTTTVACHQWWLIPRKGCIVEWILTSGIGPTITFIAVNWTGWMKIKHLLKICNVKIVKSNTWRRKWKKATERKTVKIEEEQKKKNRKKLEDFSRLFLLFDSCSMESNLIFWWIMSWKTFRNWKNVDSVFQHEFSYFDTQHWFAVSNKHKCQIELQQ